MKKPIAHVLVLCWLGVSVLSAQTAPTSDYISQIPFLQRALTGTVAVTTSQVAFETLVDTSIPVPPGLTVMLSARFSAESRCTELGSTAANWCEVRILIGDVEAEPTETSPGLDFAFDSTDSGMAQSGDYESHSMERHLCFTNTTGVIQQVPVRVEWGVTNLDGGGAPSFWIDDWSLVIQESQNCFVIPVETAAERRES